MDIRFDHIYDLLRSYYYTIDKEISKECYLLSLKLLEHLIECPSLSISRNNSIIISYRNDSRYLKIEITDKNYLLRGVIGDKYLPEKLSFSANELYKVINYVKIYFNGYPKKSVLFTGAFNPPHIGHYNMIDCVVSNGFDYIIFATSNKKFLDRKQNKNNDYSYTEQQRLDMLLEMTYSSPNALIYGIERGYTYDVLCDVKSKYNIDELYFSMGSDKLYEIERWGNNNKLLSEFCFFVVSRKDKLEDIQEKCKIFKNKYIIVENTKFDDVNATEIRKKIKENNEYINLCPKVTEYLKKL